MTKKRWNSFSFNMIRQRGDPRAAVTLSGHTVRKEEYVYFRTADGFEMVQCADYHNEHFVYINPEYNMDGERQGESSGKPGWFAMCTCGAPAVVVGKDVAVWQDHRGKLLVCFQHTNTLLKTGIGRHRGSDSTRWD